MSEDSDSDQRPGQVDARKIDLDVREELEGLVEKWSSNFPVRHVRAEVARYAIRYGTRALDIDDLRGFSAGVEFEPEEGTDGQAD